jgi:transposase
MRYVGMDLHKQSSQMVVLNESGEVLGKSRIPTRREALVDYFSKLEGPVKVALEATRNWYWVYDTIEPMVDELKLASPPKVRVIAESTIKTDQIDAKVLADLLRTNFLPSCYVPGQETRQARELLRHRAFLVQTRTKFKNRIHIVLDKLGIEHPFDNLFSKAGLEFLKGLELPWAYQKELTDSLDILKLLNEKEREQNKIIERLCAESEGAKLLMTIPGIGRHNALLIISEIGEIDRFATGGKFAGYCGLVPTVHISDQTVRYGQLTDVGNKWLRWVFIEAAHVGRLKSLRFARLYNRVKLKRGPQVAIGAVAREMAVVSFYLLRYKEPFRDDKW